MTKKFRFMTGLLAIVLAFVMLSSVAYIAAEAGHDCTGADCAICHQIHVCEKLPQRRSDIFCAGSFPPARRLPAPLRWYRSR